MGAHVGSVMSFIPGRNNDKITIFGIYTFWAIIVINAYGHIMTFLSTDLQQNRKIPYI